MRAYANVFRETKKPVMSMDKINQRIENISKLQHIKRKSKSNKELPSILKEQRAKTGVSIHKYNWHADMDNKDLNVNERFSRIYGKAKSIDESAKKQDKRWSSKR